MKMKKAISPLIATILLIVVAVALIAIVVAWGKSFTTSSLSDTSDIVNAECMGSAVQITNCSVDADGNLTFYIENIGSKTISSGDDFLVHLTNLTDSESELNSNLSDYGADFASDLTPGQMHQVSIAQADLPGTTNPSRFDVKIISSYCPSDAVATKTNCN